MTDFLFRNTIRCFILAAGDGVRWGEYLGVPKQLLKIRGETLLDRICRILHAHDIADVCVVTTDRRLLNGVRPHVHPVRRGTICDTILSCERHWGGRNIFLLGDVFYSPSVIDAMVREEAPIRFFGRPWPCRITRCAHGEIFGLTFSHSECNTVIDALEEVNMCNEHTLPRNLWNVYHTIIEAQRNSKAFETKLLKVVDDYTNDFDVPADYHRQIKIYERLSSVSYWTRLWTYLVLRMRAPMWLERRRRQRYLNSPLPEFDT